MTPLPLLPKPDGAPPWLAKLAEDATLEATVLKRPIEGKANILTLLKQAMPLYDFQDFTYRGDFGADFFMESYRAEIQGVPIECSVLVHMNAQGEADSILVNHRSLNAALLFSRLMWERVGDGFRDLYLTGPQADALDSAINPKA
jgi:hypothetical protein